MNIIVTGNKIEYEGFLKVRTLKEAVSSVGRIDFLVYHRSPESTNDKVGLFAKLIEKASNIIYICSSVHLDSAIKMMVIGSEGKYFDDEFFLESSSELNNLINSVGEITALVELGGLDVLSDFLNRYLKNGSSDKNYSTNYLMVVKNAVKDLVTSYNSKSMEIVQMSETASELFANTSELLSTLKDEQEGLKGTLLKLESDRDKGKFSGGNYSTSGVSSVSFFPQVSYMKEKTIIRLKELGNFRFLTSFCLGMRLYLENIKNLRPKLIFIMPNGKLYEDYYSSYNWVTQSTVKDARRYYSSVVFTNNPIKEVLYKLLDDPDYDTFIVVDRTKGTKDHILNSKKSRVKYAISGSSILTKFKVQIRDCITSVNELDGTICNIGSYSNYPQDRAARERFYLSEFLDVFEKVM